MNLRMSSSLAANYKSGCQRARVVTEAWGRENLFCPRCSSDRLDAAPPNTQAIDYLCPDCEAPSLRDLGPFFVAMPTDKSGGLFSFALWAFQGARGEGRL